jgi:hypothetical protein
MIRHWKCTAFDQNFLCPICFVLHVVREPGRIHCVLIGRNRIRQHTRTRILEYAEGQNRKDERVRIRVGIVSHPLIKLRRSTFILSIISFVIYITAVANTACSAEREERIISASRAVAYAG